MRKQESLSKSTVNDFHLYFKSYFPFALRAICHQICLVFLFSASWYSSLQHTHLNRCMKPGGCPEGVSHVNTVTASSIFRGFKTATF